MSCWNVSIRGSKTPSTVFLYSFVFTLFRTVLYWTVLGRYSTVLVVQYCTTKPTLLYSRLTHRCLQIQGRVLFRGQLRSPTSLLRHPVLIIIMDGPGNRQSTEHCSQRTPRYVMICALVIVWHLHPYHTMVFSYRIQSLSHFSFQSPLVPLLVDVISLCSNADLRWKKDEFSKRRCRSSRFTNIEDLGD